MVTPTEIASWPMPENHLEILPCRSRINIFCSISLDLSILKYNDFLVSRLTSLGAYWKIGFKCL